MPTNVESPRHTRLVRRTVVIGAAAVILLIGGGIIGLRSTGHSKPAPVAEAANAETATATPDAAIQRAQQRLRQVPGDWLTWAGLGSAYLERARVTADYTYYPKAEGALDKSIKLSSRDNAPALMAQALQDAADPADVAFCRFQLGELAWQDGRLDDADRQYAAGLAADP